MMLCRCVKFFMGVALLISLEGTFVAQAQQIVNPNQDQPLEITAEQTLEWHRNDRRYIARGHVIVQQGNVKIEADILTADYRESADSSFDIYRLSAEGHVVITSQENIVTGQYATYDLDQGLAVMTGDNLSLKSPDQIVTAKERFEYHLVEGRLTALGHVKVVRAEDILESDQASAVFVENAAGARTLQSLSAEGHVRITTPQEVVTGDQGHYSSDTNRAVLTGHVKIMRGPNILEGAQADVNLTTNISVMKGAADQGGTGSNQRVRGIFYPDHPSHKQ